jgi:hypothetical protein
LDGDGLGDFGLRIHREDLAIEQDHISGMSRPPGDPEFGLEKSQEKMRKAEEQD